MVAFDLDGTVLRGERYKYSWKLVWQHLGYEDHVRQQLRRRYEKEKSITYREWCDRAAEHVRAVREVIDEKPVALLGRRSNPGRPAAVRRRSSGATPRACIHPSGYGGWPLRTLMTLARPTSLA
jgi:hypothetical protein